MTCPRNHPEGDERFWWCADCHPEKYLPAPLPEKAHARSSDPWTSHHAAASISEEELRESQRDVLACFKLNGEMHHEVLVERYRSGRFLHNWKPQKESGIRSRANELWKKGYLLDTGRSVTLESGRPSIIWVAA